MKLVSTTIFPLLLVFSALTLLSTKCTQERFTERVATTNDEFTAFFVGSWYFSEEIEDGFSSYQTWSFTEVSFDLEGYPPLEQSGKLMVKKDKGNEVEVLLYEQKGDMATEDRTITIKKGEKANEIYINGRGPFLRQ